MQFLLTSLFLFVASVVGQIDPIHGADVWAHHLESNVKYSNHPATDSRHSIQRQTWWIHGVVNPDDRVWELCGDTDVYWRFPPGYNRTTKEFLVQLMQAGINETGDSNSIQLTLGGPFIHFSNDSKPAILDRNTFVKRVNLRRDDSVCRNDTESEPLWDAPWPQRIGPVSIQNLITTSLAEATANASQSAWQWHYNFTVTDASTIVTGGPPVQQPPLVTSCSFEWGFKDPFPTKDTAVPCDNGNATFYLDVSNSYNVTDHFRLNINHEWWNGADHSAGWPANQDMMIKAEASMGFNATEGALCGDLNCFWAKDPVTFTTLMYELGPSL